MSVPQQPLADWSALAQSEKKEWNKLADLMDVYHESFRRDFNTLQESADGSFNQRGMSLPMFLNVATSLIRRLDMHHMVEESSLFPMLAQRMPEFSQNEKHKTSHKQIHDGLDKLSALVKKWKKDTTTYSPSELLACLESFREVLFRHLDEEVSDIGGENMRKYWTLDEMDRFMG